MNQIQPSLPGAQTPVEKRASIAKPPAGTIAFGSILGIPFYVHLLHLLLFPGVLFLTYIAGGISLCQFVVGTAAALLFHEWGHALVAWNYGYTVRSVTVFPFQSTAIIEGELQPEHEVRIALGGPAINFLIAVCLWGFLAIAGDPFLHLKPLHRIPGGDVLFRLLFINLLLAGGNLLPALPFDGGRCLRAFLTERLGRGRAVQVVGYTGLWLGLAIGIAGLCTRMPVFAVLGFLVCLGIQREAEIERRRTLLRGATIEQAMLSEFRTLTIGDRMSRATALLLASPQRYFPVLHGDEVVGLLTRESIHRTLSAKGDSAYTTEGMIKQVNCMQATDSLESGVLRLQEIKGVPLIILRDETLVGMLTQESIYRFFSVQAASASRSTSV